MSGMPRYSEDTEGPILRDFVNGTLVNGNEDMASPRTELLSPTSNPGGPNPMFLEPRRRRRREPTERYRRERELAYSNTPHHELLRLLIDQEYEATKMRKTLYTAIERLEIEAQRAAEAERATKETALQFRRLNEERIGAMQTSARANEELRMYKFQLDTAQREILRAQETLKTVETQRFEAEKSAARARTVARELHQERMVHAAREEGRRLGFEAGFRRAQMEVEASRGGRREDLAVSRYEGDMDDAIGDENPEYERRNGERSHPEDEAAYPEDRYAREVYRANEQNGTDSVSSASPSALPLRILGTESERSPEVVRLRAPSDPPQPQPPQPPQQQQYPPPPLPVPITEPVPAPIPPPLSNSPGIQVFSVPIPSPSEAERDYNVNPSTSSNSRNRNQPQPWPQTEHPRKSLRPTRSSSSSIRPPDNFIPPSNEAGYIPIPPPHGFTQTPSHPRYSSGTPSEAPVPLPPETGSAAEYLNNQPSVRVRDFAYPEPNSNPVPKNPSSGNSRRYSVESGSNSTRLSQLDIITPPGTSVGDRDRERDRERGYRRERELSIIREDMDGNGSGVGSPSGGLGGVQRSRSMGSRTSLGSAGYGSPGNGVEFPVQGGNRMVEKQREREMGMGMGMERGNREQEVKQRVADELRYSDPHEVEEWRRMGAETQGMSSRGGPPRHVRRPVQLSTPAPLAPSASGGPPGSTARTRTTSGASSELSSGAYGNTNMRPRLRTMSGESGFSSNANTNGNRPSLRRVDRRVSASEMSPPVVIQIEPPSRSPSDTPAANSASFQVDNRLSPRSAERPLPIPSPRSPSTRRSDVPPVPTVPNSPTTPTLPMMWPSQGDGLPPGFVPHSATVPVAPLPVAPPPVLPVPAPQNQNGNRPPSIYGGSSFGDQRAMSPNPIPIPGPGASNPLPVPMPYNGAPSLRGFPDGPSRPTSAMGNHPPYQSAPSPSFPPSTLLNFGGATPRQAEEPLPPSGPGSNRSHTPHRQSMNAGMTPATLGRTLSGDNSNHGGSDHSLNRATSNNSLGSRGSYGRYSGENYLDPAYYPSDTQANTRSNAGAPRTRNHSRANSGASLEYITE